MKDAEKIARETLVGHTFIAVDRKRYVGLLAEPVEERIATALRSAYSAGYAAAREQAAGEVERWSLPTIQTPSMWLVDKAGIAAAIRSMEPRDE